MRIHVGFRSKKVRQTAVRLEALLYRLCILSVICRVVTNVLYRMFKPFCMAIKEQR